MLLIQKPASVGDIVTIKLRSAEEVIGRVDSDTGEVLTLSKPMTLTYGSNGIGLTNWIITADPMAKIGIPKEHIMISTPSMKSAADQYIKATTGIETVSRL
jgi:hypothetical protein